MNNINRKLRTRKALMNSALELVDEGQHFSSLSIREVAKRAGVVPNAFYRHFKSLDELGLALGDEVSSGDGRLKLPASSRYKLQCIILGHYRPPARFLLCTTHHALAGMGIMADSVKSNRGLAM